jgi:hypothetical protein
MIYSPIHAPYGLRLSTWSKTIFSAPVIGTANINPIAPQSHPQKSSEIVTASGFSDIFFPMIFG